MSRSPRQVLRTAAEALDAVHELCERYPDARAEITSALGGPQQVAVLEEARWILRMGVTAAPNASGAAVDEADPVTRE